MAELLVDQHTTEFSERRNHFSERPRAPYRAAVNPSMGPSTGPSISDILHGSRREDGSGTRSDGL